MKQTWTTEEENILKTQFTLLGPKQCLALLPNHTYGAIKNKARKFGIKMNKEQWCMVNTAGQNAIRKYGATLTLFNPISTPEVAYFLGFLWADGHVTKNQHEIRFGNVLEDIKDVVKIFDFVGTWSKKEMNRCGNNKIKLRMKLHHSEFCQYLIKFDYHIKSGASPWKILSIIPDNLKHYWWRGYLDGDGHVTKSIKEHKIIFASTYDQDWGFLSLLPTEYTVKRRDYTNRYSQGQIIGKENSKKVLDYIYQGYEQDLIGFSRKYNTYKIKYLDPVPDHVSTSVSGIFP